MSKTGPIILVEDDEDDRSIFSDVIQHLNIANELVLFHNGVDCLSYLKSTDQAPFLIFCDINLPLMNGIEFKRAIDTDLLLRRKSIPFIFCSTTVSQKFVDEAYLKLNIQGFFEKPNSFSSLIDMVNNIIKYWNECRHPNS